MPTLFIPTRNRPVSLCKVLEYLAAFYPQTRVIIADGSTDQYRQQNQRSMESMAAKLAIDYRAYPQDTGYVARSFDVLRSEADEFIVFGADDEYPNMEVMIKGENFLSKNPDYVTALGTRVALIMGQDEVISQKLKEARPIQNEQAWRRMKSYAEWSFATTYAVTRRTHILARLQRLQNRAPAGFFDFIVGLYDAWCGKIKAFPEIGFFTTRTYVHNFFRPGSKLFFLHHSDTVLALQKDLENDLRAENALTETRTGELSEIMIRNRIAELTGRDLSTLATFHDSPHFNHHIIQKQYELFDQLLDHTSQTYQTYADRLGFIQDAMRYVAKSGKGKPGTCYSFLDDRVDEDGVG